jgi:cell division protein FtsA
MNKRILAGIDIGSSKITTIIASIPEGGQVNVLGVATNPSRGIKKGQIVDIEESTASIVESLEAAERMAGYSISSAFISVGGAHINSQNSHGVVAVSEPQKEISADDVRRAVDAAKAVSLPSTREILHVLPREFIVDAQEDIRDPIGMTGVRLEVNTHLITVGSIGLRNLEKCASLVGIDVDGFVFGGLASATAVLTETEKELGVVLVDFGAGTTDICIFIEGAIAYSAVLPIGARNLTNDLAIGLRISLESAEKIKLLLNSKRKEITVPVSQNDEHQKKDKKNEPNDDIDLSSLQLPEGLTKVSKRTIVEGIIRPRLNEIFSMVGMEIKKSGFGGLTPAGLVLCGGGAETIGITDSVKRNLAMQVRVGNPGNITGLIDEIITPGYATSVGLVLYTAKSNFVRKEKFNLGKISNFAGKVPLQGVAKKVVDIVKSFLP